MSDSLTSGIDLDNNRRVDEIIRELNQRLKPITEEIGEKFGCALWPSSDNREMPLTWRWISCFVVQGRSEGYYVHIEVIHQDDDGVPFQGKRELLALAKCWSWDDAFKLSNAATRVLYGYQPT